MTKLKSQEEKKKKTHRPWQSVELKKSECFQGPHRSILNKRYLLQARGLCSTITNPTHLHYSLLSRPIVLSLGVWYFLDICVLWSKRFQRTEFIVTDQVEIESIRFTLQQCGEAEHAVRPSAQTARRSATRPRPTQGRNMRPGGPSPTNPPTDF